jgi:hypothetical protein
LNGVECLESKVTGFNLRHHDNQSNRGTEVERNGCCVE